MPKKDQKLFRVAVGAEPADKPISTLRADLRISPQLFYGTLCFVVKDPVTLRYFRLQPVEHFLVTQLDGARTARDLLGLLQQRFPDCGLAVNDVLRFVGMLHESHLLVGEGIAHAEWLGEQRRTAHRRRFMEAVQNFLAFRIPLFNPNRLLGWLDNHFGRFIFRPSAVIVALGLIAAALLRLSGETDRLFNMPYSLLSWQNLAILYCVFVVTKVFHEFGHGLTTKHFGGEVSEMGIMLLALTPSFYCDTSDAWTIPSRKARLWINAGGISIELVLAALATFLWCGTQYGVINQIALNIMISCSVATIFFNGNPLMRYDGYYFLADLLEIPNLMSKGTQFIQYYLKKYVLGLKPQLPPDAKRVTPLMFYAVFSGIYRWIVMFGIILLIYTFFDRYGLGPIGVLLAVVYVALSVLMPMFKALKFLWKQRWDMSRRLAWMAAATALGCGLLFAISEMPWSMTIREPLVVLSQNQDIRVQSPGYIAAVACDIGAHVHKNDLILQLRDPVLDSELARAKIERQLADLERSSAMAAQKPDQLQAAQSKWNAYNQQVALFEKQTADLALRAPMDGILVAEVPLKHIIGNYVPQGATLCRVINDGELKAKISLPQQKIADVHEGMYVRIRLWANADSLIEARVAAVNPLVDDTMLDPRMSTKAGGEVDMTAGDKGQEKSLGRRGTVVLESLEKPGVYLADGMTGRAEITIEKSTVRRRLWRLILDSTTPDWHL